MKINIPNRKINIKHPTIIDEETGRERSITWKERIELVIKPQIDTHEKELMP